MTVNVSEHELYKMFREQLPAVAVPADFRALLQRRLLVEVAQTLVPTGHIGAATVPHNTFSWFSRLIHFVRHLQLILPAAFIGVGSVGLLLSLYYLSRETFIGELLIRNNLLIEQVGRLVGPLATLIWGKTNATGVIWGSSVQVQSLTTLSMTVLGVGCGNPNLGLIHTACGSTSTITHKCFEKNVMIFAPSRMAPVFVPSRSSGLAFKDKPTGRLRVGAFTSKTTSKKETEAANSLPLSLF